MPEPVPLTDEQRAVLENVHIVLVEPEDPANIGAVARALKNTGIPNLTLVQPFSHIPQGAFWVAHASEEILHCARICRTLEEALNPMHFVVGTTQRKRIPYFPLLLPEEAVQRALPVAARYPVAFVFGRESRGLDNVELYQCNVWSRIPSPVVRPAFNLAQSVLIYAYTFYREVVSRPFFQTLEIASHKEYEIFFRKVSQLLERVGFSPRDGMARFVARMRRAFGYLPMESRDLGVLMTIAEAIERKLDREN